ncbi:PLAT domain-containing protein 3-like [Rhodamnia argentea]|uniref:PLAT domain-containing protein 3-like n=1 Tax=Rhodamnia argentea TaxID=178133 RepID=A0A8B8PK46_9MYRT|nr:PLAT domain-containing protein 3-like [Rhodamnia argentea]
MASINAWFIFFLLLLSISVQSESFEGDCVYTVYVRTGSIIKGGTDSIVSLRLYDVYGEWVGITDLEAWGGLMEPGHNYYERGNLDVFSGRGPCLSAPICALNLTSDGSGPHHGWYCNYVEVTTTGVHTPCSQQQFTVEQWLASDAPPYELSAIRNYCPSSLDGVGGGGKIGSHVVADALM